VPFRIHQYLVKHMNFMGKSASCLLSCDIHRSKEQMCNFSNIYLALVISGEVFDLVNCVIVCLFVTIDNGKCLHLLSLNLQSRSAIAAIHRNTDKIAKEWTDHRDTNIKLLEAMP